MKPLLIKTNQALIEGTEFTNLGPCLIFDPKVFPVLLGSIFFFFIIQVKNFPSIALFSVEFLSSLQGESKILALMLVLQKELEVRNQWETVSRIWEKLLISKARALDKIPDAPANC